MEIVLSRGTNIASHQAWLGLSHLGVAWHGVAWRGVLRRMCTASTDESLPLPLSLLRHVQIVGQIKIDTDIGHEKQVCIRAYARIHGSRASCI